MCCEARGNGNGSAATGACLVFFRFMAVLATIGGITLVAIGASSWGHREVVHSQQVQAYQNAVSDFPSPWTSTTALPQATLQQGNRTNKFAPQSGIVAPLDGNSPEVHAVETRLLATTVLPFDSNAPLNLSVYSPNASKQAFDSITLLVPGNKMITQPIYCSSAACASGCGSDNMMCSVASLLKACQVQFNAFASYIGDNQCNNGDLCGNCFVESYLTTACFVVAPTDDGGYVFDRTMQSCFYPFTSDAQQYSVSGTVPQVATTTVTVQLRINSDPFIFLQRATQGSMTFPSSSVSGPIVLVGIGIALIVSFWCGLGCHRACTRSRHHRVEDEMSGDSALRVAPYPPAPQGVAAPMPMQQAPVEGVFYAQGPMPLHQAPPFAVPSDPPHTVNVGPNAENYPGVPMKPLQR